MTRLSALFVILHLACAAPLWSQELSIDQLEGKPAPTFSGTQVTVPATKPDPERMAREALKVKDIVYSKGKVYITWFDPFPMDRTYLLQSERITTMAAVVRADLAALEKAGGTSKLATGDIMKRRKELEDELAAVTKKNRVISEWRPVKDVTITTKGKDLKQATFPALEGARRMNVRITSIAPDGTRSPFRALVHIPLQEQPGFFAKYWKPLLGALLLVVFSGFLIWSLSRRGILPSLPIFSRK